MVSATEDFGSLDARGALGLWAASWCLIRPVRRLLCGVSGRPSLWLCHLWSLGDPRAVWGEVLWVFVTLCLPAAGARWWLGRPPPCRLCATCQAFSSLRSLAALA